MFAILTALALAVPGGNPPQIVYFYVYVSPDNVLMVDGTVEDDGDLTGANAFIYFRGDFWDIPCDQSGYFFMYEQLQPSESGIVTAEAIDDENLLSEQVQQYAEAYPDLLP